MFFNEQTTYRFGGPGRSSPTVSRKNTHTHTHKMDRDENAFQRIVGNQGGNEKAAGF